MAAVFRRCARIALVATLGLALVGPAAARADTVAASVTATPTGHSMGSGFVGVSFEYRALHQYTGRNPLAVDPVLIQLLKGLVPGQSPVIRIGGDSADGTWWPLRRMIAPAGLYYPLTPGWMRTTQAMARATGARLILGINLAAGRAALAAAEGRALLAGIGRRFIDAFEIGNEPDLYRVFPWYRDRRGHLYWARTRTYDLTGYTKQFTQWSRALPRVPLAGPVTSGPAWMGKLGRFIAAEPRLKLVTYHRYPLRACVTDPSAKGFPTIPGLLDDSSSQGLAQGLSSYVHSAHSHKLPFRVAEMNSASCKGLPGVSDTFASALWALDTLFNLASVGVDGVNFHMLPGSAYELFTTSQDASGNWQAFVHPEYYGLLMFAQAFPPGARLLRVAAPGGPVKVWATVGADGVRRVVLINKDPGAEHDVSLGVAGATARASLQALTAPSVNATSGVTLGGQTFGAQTTSGVLRPPATTTVAPAGSTYSVALPAGSAAMLTIAGSPAPAGSSGGGGSGGGAPSGASAATAR
jgi:Glycosyl hydrolase family 79 C-terminal beta domain